MSELRDIFKDYAMKHNLLRLCDRLLVAVSGGPDSVSLLHLLCEFKNEWDLHLEVAHLQHGIRGDAAQQDAMFVERLAEELKLPFHMREVDLPRLKSAAGRGNLEALARAERYRFFAELVASRKLSKVATAHTQDDQAETVLMWFLRGAGLRGLGGMAPLVITTRKAFCGGYSPEEHSGLTYAAMYWHFLDAVWLVLFATLKLTVR